ncbi:hypothetical protein D3C72_2011740 [compost metagenome]
MSDLERLGREVDAQHVGALARHRIGQDAAAAADIDHALARNRRNTVNPFQPQWIDFVQRAEFALQIPPPVCEFRKLGQFGRVCIHVFCHGAIMKRAKPGSNAMGLHQARPQIPQA